MKVVLHDLEPSRFESLYPKLARDSFIVGEEGPVRNCVGCFGCWCKTPGKCVIPDGYGDFGKRLGACGEYLIPVSYTHLDVYKRQAVPRRS